MVELIIRERLRKNRAGFRFRFQHYVQGFYLDFYCPEAHLGLEFDGEQHDAVRDAWRDAKLAELGIEIMRIPNRDFFMLDPDPDGSNYIDWIEQIVLRCEARTGRKVQR